MTQFYYITKYGLTQGILQRARTDFTNRGDNRVFCKINGLISFFTLGETVFENLPAAHAKVEEMRLQKIANLQSQITKLQNMKLKVKE